MRVVKRDTEHASAKRLFLQRPDSTIPGDLESPEEKKTDRFLSFDAFTRDAAPSNAKTITATTTTTTKNYRTANERTDYLHSDYAKRTLNKN